MARETKQNKKNASTHENREQSSGTYVLKMGAFHVRPAEHKGARYSGVCLVSYSFAEGFTGDRFHYL
jgi:hypothetical protein